MIFFNWKTKQGFKEICCYGSNTSLQPEVKYHGIANFLREKKYLKSGRPSIMENHHTNHHSEHIWQKSVKTTRQNIGYFRYFTGISNN